MDSTENNLKRQKDKKELKNGQFRPNVCPDSAREKSGIPSEQE